MFEGELGLMLSAHISSTQNDVRKLQRYCYLHEIWSLHFFSQTFKVNFFHHFYPISGGQQQRCCYFQILLRFGLIWADSISPNSPSTKFFNWYYMKKSFPFSQTFDLVKSQKACMITLWQLSFGGWIIFYFFQQLTSHKLLRKLPQGATSILHSR